MDSNHNLHCQKVMSCRLDEGTILSGRQDLNLQPDEPRSSILPIEILPGEVGKVGFEPAKPKCNGFTVRPNSPSLALSRVIF